MVSKMRRFTKNHGKLMTPSQIRFPYNSLGSEDPVIEIFVLLSPLDVVSDKLS
jgi:hypothetical protein